MNEQLSITYLSIHAIELHPKNYKKHDLKSLVESITRYGFKDPIALNKNKAVAGNGRIEALRAMYRTNKSNPPLGIQLLDGDWYAPCLALDFASDQEALAYLVDHNNLTLLGGFEASEMLKIWGEGIDEVLAALKMEEAAPITIPEVLGIPQLPKEHREIEISERWDLLIECESEPRQLEIINLLAEKGIKCRALIS